MNKNRLLSLVLPLAIMGLASFYRFYPHNYCAPGLVLLRHDELNYLMRVLAFLNGEWDVHYFINPTLYAYVLYAATMVSGWWDVLTGQYASPADFSLAVTFDPYPMLVAGRWVTIVVGTLTVGLVYAVSRRMFSPWVAVIASLALAVDVTHARRGVLSGNECVTTFFCVLFFALLLHYLSKPGTWRHALCGFVLGLACAAKYNALIFVLPFMAATWIAMVREEKLDHQPIWNRCCTFINRAIVKPKYMLGNYVFFIGFFVASPCILLNIGEFTSEFFKQYSYLSDGFSDFDRAADHLGYLYYVTNFPEMNSGLFFSAFCGVGLVAMLVAAVVKRDYRYILLLLAALPLYLFLGMGSFSRMRFMLPAIPFILIIGAWALVGIFTVEKRLFKYRQHLCIAALAVAGTMFGAMQVHRIMDEVYGHDPRHELMLWINENVDKDDKTIEFTHNSLNQFPGSTRVLDLYQYDEAWFEPGPRQQAWQQFKDGLHHFVSLQGLLSQAGSMEELKTRIRDGGYDNLLVTLPTGFYHEIDKLPQVAPKVIKHCPYWIEFLEYIAGLNLRHQMSSEDGSLSIMLYELR